MLKKLIVLMALWLTACAAQPTPVPTPTVTPRPTATPSPTPTPTPIPHCPAPQSVAPWNPPTDFNGYPDAIRAYLNAGGPREALTAILTNASSITTTVGGVQTFDLTGDGELETIVSIYDPATLDRSPAPAGLLLIYGCSNRQAVLLYADASDNGSSLPRPIKIGNLVAAKRGGQVAVQTSTCGAHTCFEQLDVLGWNGSTFVSLMGTPLSLPSATFTFVVAPGDPAFEIEAQGGTINSVGAGPQRTEKQIWKWNGSQYVKAATELSPVEYRIHAIYEGDDAFTAGDYARAVDWYSRAITDDNLKDWHAEIGYRTQNDRAILTAYARFRLLLIGVVRGDANARDQLDQLTAQFPDGTPGYLTRQMAQTFWDKYEATNDLKAACAEANAYANSGDNNQYLIVDDLNLFGYTNRTYTSDDMCPVK